LPFLFIVMIEIQPFTCLRRNGAVHRKNIFGKRGVRTGQVPSCTVLAYDRGNHPRTLRLRGSR